MKSQNLILILFLLTMGINSCKTTLNAQKTEVQHHGDNSMTSLDWPGIYQGVLSCADCEGIKTQVELNEDFTYTLKTQFLGNSDSVFQGKGKFVWNDAGAAITLDNSNHHTYQVGENVLYHLDKNGKPITGDLSEKHTLKKEKVEITGKYWKLIRLNGQPVKLANREPFIRLNEDFSVNGNSSCNSFNGKYNLTDGNRIKFSPFALTKMACIDNNIEDELMQILEKTKSFSVSSNELIFQDEFETSLAIFEFDFFNQP